MSKNNSKNWKTTKEVAEELGVSTRYIREIGKVLKLEEERLVMRNTDFRTEKQGGELIWSPEAIKKIIPKLSTPQIKDWKNNIIEQFTDKGIVLKNMPVDEQMVMVISAMLENAKSMVVLRENQEEENKRIRILENKMDNIFSFVATIRT